MGGHEHAPEPQEHHGPEHEGEEHGGIFSGLMKGVGWLGKGMHIAEGIEGGVHIAKALGHEAPKLLGGAADLVKGGGKAMPIVGGLLSGASMAYEGYEAYQNFSKGGYHCDKAWNNVGGTLLGGAGVGLAAAYCTPAAPYAAAAGGALAVGEGVADAGGWAAGKLFGKGAEFSADNVVGGLARGTFGDKSWGEGVSNMLGGGVGGHIAGTALNAATLPFQLAGTIGSGIANEIGAIGSGIMNGDGLVGEGVHAIGSGIGAAASWVGGGISSVGSAIGSVLPSGW